jgi:hypothetical protein
MIIVGMIEKRWTVNCPDCSEAVIDTREYGLAAAAYKDHKRTYLHEPEPPEPYYCLTLAIFAAFLPSSLSSSPS